MPNCLEKQKPVQMPEFGEVESEKLKPGHEVAGFKILQCGPIWIQIDQLTYKYCTCSVTGTNRLVSCMFPLPNSSFLLIFLLFYFAIFYQSDLLIQIRMLLGLPDPDPLARLRIRIWNLVSSSKNSKKNLDS
jgi:hypothetical protein